MRTGVRPLMWFTSSAGSHAIPACCCRATVGLWVQPLVHSASSSLCSHPVLGRQMLREKPMVFRKCLEQRQTPRIPLRDNQPRVNKGLPEVGVEQHMSDGSLANRRGDPPVEPHSFTRLFLVFCERTTGCTHKPTVARQQHAGMASMTPNSICSIIPPPPAPAHSARRLARLFWPAM